MQDERKMFGLGVLAGALIAVLFCAGVQHEIYKQWKQDAIDHGVAGYNVATGQWEWRVRVKHRDKYNEAWQDSLRALIGEDAMPNTYPVFVDPKRADSHHLELRGEK